MTYREMPDVLGEDERARRRRSELAFVHVKLGGEPCPDCTTAMSECRVERHILERAIKPRVDVSFCNIPERNGIGLKLPPKVKL